MQKYLTIYRLSFIHALKNYKALVGLSIFLITCLIIFAHIWKIAAAKAGAVSYSPEKLLWYIAFNEWVLISIPDTQEGHADIEGGWLVEGETGVDHHSRSPESHPGRRGLISDYACLPQAGIANFKDLKSTLMLQ